MPNLICMTIINREKTLLFMACPKSREMEIAGKS